MRTDTIRIDSIVRRDTLYRDSLVTHPHTYYFPQDVALRYSVAHLQQVGMERYSRLDSLVCRVEFLTEVKALPRLRSLDKPSSPEDRLYWATAKGRSVDFWLRDPDLIARDSVRFTLTYPKTDSLFVVREQTDTLLFVKPPTRTKKATKEATPERSPLQLTLAGAKGLASGTPGDSLYLVASRPLEAFPSSAIRLEVRQDSTYKPQPFTLEVDSLDRLRYTLRFDRAYGHSYRATLDSAALRDIYGAVSDSTAYTQQIQKEEELGHLSVTLQGIRSDALVQLLDKSDAVLLQARATEVKSDSTQSSPASSTAARHPQTRAAASKQSNGPRTWATDWHPRPRRWPTAVRAPSSWSTETTWIRLPDGKPSATTTSGTAHAARSTEATMCVCGATTMMPSTPRAMRKWRASATSSSKLRFRAITREA